MLDPYVNLTLLPSLLPTALSDAVVRKSGSFHLLGRWKLSIADPLSLFQRELLHCQGGGHRSPAQRMRPSCYRYLRFRVHHSGWKTLLLSVVVLVVFVLVVLIPFLADSAFVIVLADPAYAIFLDVGVRMK